MAEAADDATTQLASEFLESVDTSPGAVIAGRFRVETLIGRGGYGEVWRAHQLRVDRTVALKLLRADVARREEAGRRFEREARLASRLNHPNAVRVIDFGDDNGTLFLAMEFVRGPTLRERLREQGRIPWREASRIVERIAAALHAAHSLGLVHRDLKPANVLLTPVDGLEQPIVIDFGLAKIFDDDEQDETLTRANAMLGTPAYMCPEVVRGAPIDQRSDLYSLGILLFELVAGRVPYRGATAIETATLHLHGTLPDLRALVTDLHEPFVELVERLLRREPAERPASASEVMQNIDILLRAPIAAPGDPLDRTDVIDATVMPMLRPTAAAVATQPPAAVYAASAGAATAQVTPSEYESDAATTPTAPRKPATDKAPARPISRQRWILAAIGALIAASGTTFLLRASRATPPGDAAVLEPASTLAATQVAELPPNAPNTTGQTEAVGSSPPPVPEQAPPTDGSGTGNGENGGDITAHGAAAAEDAVAAPAAAVGADIVAAANDVRPRRSEREAPVATGTLSIRVEPTGVVYVDGERVGDAPIDGLTLPVGRHEVRIVHGELEHRESFEVIEGRERTIRHNFTAITAPGREGSSAASP